MADAGHTRKANKVLALVLLAFMVMAALALFGICQGWIRITSSERLPNLYRGNIPQAAILADADGDGTDDQADILNSAIGYIRTRPAYKSKYYAGGYPTDRYGVCTDVAAFALRGAGYDLRQLVARDMRAHPDRYDVKNPDPDIDFRRVKNLSAFFAGNAVSLTTDVRDVGAWQGGDIVIFQKHIGIVSDRRNADGIPYVIHHNSPWQRSYEEDILGKRSDITGHYRMPP